MTGHCNGGCQVGWTGAMCEKGHDLTIKNTHGHVYILKTVYISTIKGYLSYYNFMDNNLFCLDKKMNSNIMLTVDSPNHYASPRDKTTQRPMLLDDE